MKYFKINSYFDTTEFGTADMITDRTTPYIVFNGDDRVEIDISKSKKLVELNKTKVPRIERIEFVNDIVNKFNECTITPNSTKFTQELYDDMMATYGSNFECKHYMTKYPNTLIQVGHRPFKSCPCVYVILHIKFEDESNNYKNIKFDFVPSREYKDSTVLNKINNVINFSTYKSFTYVNRIVVDIAKNNKAIQYKGRNLWISKHWNRVITTTPDNDSEIAIGIAMYVHQDPANLIQLTSDEYKELPKNNCDIMIDNVHNITYYIPGTSNNNFTLRMYDSYGALNMDMFAELDVDVRPYNYISTSRNCNNCEDSSYCINCSDCNLCHECTSCEECDMCVRCKQCVKCFRCFDHMNEIKCNNLH